MYSIFSFKQFLRTSITHIWPLSIVVIMGIILLTPRHDFGVIHTSPLADAIFGLASDPAYGLWREMLVNTLTFFAWLLIVLVILRIGLGLMANNKRLFKDLTSRLTNRKPAVVWVELSGLDGLTLTNRLYRLQKQEVAAEIILNYTVKLDDTTLVRINYLDKMAREGWRIRLGQATQAVVQMKQALPIVHILSKATTASQSSIIERLRDPKQYLRLEGDFSDVFSVYVARGYELFALDVLNPLVMQQLKQSCREVDVEMNGHTLQITTPSFRLAPNEVAAFEKNIQACLAILAPYVKKQRRLTESKQLLQYQYFENTIRPMKLLADSIFIWLTVCFGVVVCLILISQFLPIFPDQIKKIGGFSIIYLNPWKDTLEALSYCIIALASITFSLAEIEIAIRRFIVNVQWHRTRNTRHA